MPRLLRVGAAQIGPIYRDDTRGEVVERLIALMEEAERKGVELVCYPECALSTFFPRYLLERSEAERYFEESMPNPSVQPLFDQARELGVGFHLGYSELDGGNHYNSSILVDKEGRIIGKYRKSHIPGTSEPIPGQRFQHLERRYFLEGDTGFSVWDAFGGKIGMAICNDRRWPETWRVLGMQGVELVIVGWNTPLTHYRKGISYSRLTEFHSKLSLQAGCYQNGTWAVGVAHCGEEEPDYVLMGQSMIVSPLGEVVALSTTLRDELISSTIDLDAGKEIKEGVFNFELYRRPELYKIISEPTGTNPSKG
ncbi:MAG: N-carbamoyl-D-amino-acid hydrolase [Candidatus Bathyarchaeota archaeon]|nr:MAG: N-carbamoyl-D-amino-acid hydrolase [Candidatus Bathyarchaeota archaeon]